MANPYEFPHYLILASGRNRAFPFALLSARGLVAYFDTRAAAVQFIQSEVAQ